MNYNAMMNHEEIVKTKKQIQSERKILGYMNITIGHLKKELHYVETGDDELLTRLKSEIDSGIIFNNNVARKLSLLKLRLRELQSRISTDDLDSDIDDWEEYIEGGEL